MFRFRRTASLLSLLFLFQSMLVGSGVLCEGRATNAAASRNVHGAHSGHAMAAMAHSVTQRGLSASAEPVGCVAMSPNGCGLPNAPTSNHCASLGSCASPSAVVLSAADRTLATVSSPALNAPGRAPHSWTQQPQTPPPRA